MEDLSKIVETLAANNQKLRVAVTKTSAQGEEAQKATPNMMSFSNNENSIWFNAKKYGILNLTGLAYVNNETPSSEIVKILGAATKENYDKLLEYFNTGGLAVVSYVDVYYP